MNSTVIWWVSCIFNQNSDQNSWRHTKFSAIIATFKLKFLRNTVVIYWVRCISIKNSYRNSWIISKSSDVFDTEVSHQYSGQTFEEFHKNSAVIWFCDKILWRISMKSSSLKSIIFVIFPIVKNKYNNASKILFLTGILIKK